MDLKSARIAKPGEPLEIGEIERPKPSGSQVLIKVQSAGVCHSDIHLWEGGYEGIEGQFLKTDCIGLSPDHKISALHLQTVVCHYVPQVSHI